LSVTAQGSSYVLEIRYSNPDPHIAQQRAQAIAQAYTSFRSSSSKSSGTDATLITPASLPTSPSSPSYVIDIGAALILGLALAVATAWGRDQLDDRLRGPFDLERQADANVLAVIPAFRPDGREPSRRLAMAATDVLALIPAFRPDGREPSRRPAMAVSPDSMAAEAYQGLCKRLLRVEAARNSRTFVVTSPAWEDRGTVAANLAAAFAESGYKTVLVCADLHSGCAHRLLGIRDDSLGLAELLERRTSLTSALRATRIPGLQCLPPGAVTDSAGWPGHAWLAVLNEISSQADVLVIEAPSLLTSSDVLPLADGAEVTLLIADARTSTRAQVRAAARELKQERVRIAGCVLLSVGRRRRLEPGHHQSPHAPDRWSRRTPANNSNVSVISGSDIAPPGPDSESAKERQ
jgi:polysaccharide biosynthesis transport protein